MWHRVEAGETVSGLSERYGVPQDDIVEINDIAQDHVLAGNELFIPGARPRDGEDAPKAGPSGAPPPSAVAAPPPEPGRMRWPVRGGRVSSGFGTRWGRQHEGIDIAAPEGTQIVAAAGGRVIYSGEMRGYGNVVLVEHPSRLVTVYAHNEENLVAEGDEVDAGDPVARLGQTGKATGPHLHFEVRRGVLPLDPSRYLEAD